MPFQIIAGVAANVLGAASSVTAFEWGARLLRRSGAPGAPSQGPAQGSAPPAFLSKMLEAIIRKMD